MKPCPECGSTHTTTIETRRHTSGTVRRRHECYNCLHRWTIYDGDPPGHRGGWVQGRRHKAYQHLTEDQVRLILTSPLSNAELARMVGRSRWGVSRVRVGRCYAKVCPDLPRRTAGASCHDCQHWDHGRCGMGFPDPVEEGPGFAGECSMFAQ